MSVCGPASGRNNRLTRSPRRPLSNGAGNEGFYDRVVLNHREREQINTSLSNEGFYDRVILNHRGIEQINTFLSLDGKGLG